MLLLDLIVNDILASGLSYFVINHSSRNRSKEKHVEEDKDYVENVIGLVILNCQNLKIRIEVVSSHPIHVKNHS